LDSPSFLFTVLPVLLFSIVVHEYAHGYVANLWGDPTAAVAGRLTLNPIPHIDPVGSILIPILLLIGPGGFIFGWAKPVPVNPDNYRDRRWGDVTVSLAGPASNVLLAVLFTVVWIVSRRVTGGDPALDAVFGTAVLLNLILATFNLLPIPPLDGSHVLYNFLPQPLAYNYMSLARYGLLILLILFWLPPFRQLLGYVMLPAQIAALYLRELVLQVG
jgi:Zn-dependent protease